MRRNGFTLIEVMLSLALLALLLGGLFGTVRATLRTTAELRDGQRVEQAVYGLFELCRPTFALLPPQATLGWSDNGTGAAPLPDLALRNAPEAFAMGRQGYFTGEIALGTQREKDGSLTLDIAYRRIDPATGLIVTAPDPVWLPLLKGAGTVRWDFYDGAAAQWQPMWTDPSRHPALVRLTLAFPDDDRQWSEVFWLPPLATRIPVVRAARAPGAPAPPGGGPGPEGTPSP